MSLSLVVVIAGIVIMIGLAATVGVLDAGSRRAAWNRIAARRRELGERERALREWHLDLLGREAALGGVQPEPPA